MLAPSSNNLGNILDLTLPERMDGAGGGFVETERAGFADNLALPAVLQESFQSLAMAYWWAAATTVLLSLPKEPAIEPKEPAREAAVLAFVLFQFVSMIFIWTTFYMVRLR
jgi:hypothetical protein